MVRSIGVDESERQLLDDVAEYGWHCIHIMEEGEQVGYSFTVGMYQTFGHPELIIFGLSSRVSHQILSIFADAAQAGTPLDLSQPTDALIDHYSCCFAEVPLSEYYEHVGFARWYYQETTFRFTRLCGRPSPACFPGTPVSAEFRAAQPVLGQAANGN